MRSYQSKTSSSSGKQPNIATKSSSAKSHVTTTSSDHEYKCDFCGKGHQNYTCPEFRALSLQQRLSKVRERNTCFNCLRKGHISRECPSDKTCYKCKKRHHSLLHVEERVPPSAAEDKKPSGEIDSNTPRLVNSEPRSDTQTQLTTASCSSTLPMQQVLLLTAVVEIMVKNYKPYPCLILLDSGSQANLISRSMIDTLGLEQFPLNVTVKGVNSTKSHLSTCSVVRIRSNYSDFRASIQCLITDNVTVDLPTTSFDVSDWVLPVGIQLADPTFHHSGKVDMLIGSQWFLKLLLPGEISLAENLPILKETQFFWVLGGNYGGDTYSDPVLHSHAVTLDDLDQLIRRFWEVEEISNKANYSCDEECEKHFLNIYRRINSERYVVQLPLKETFDELGDSRSLALRRFYALEKRLNQDPELKQQYFEFIEEYVQLGHFKEVFECNDSPGTRKYEMEVPTMLRDDQIPEIKHFKVVTEDSRVCSTEISVMSYTTTISFYSEMKESMKVIVRVIQHEEFKDDCCLSP
ncbi:uncharacterized protein LOC131428938 [Malaya genurostris]|uniref:uncharacterized protein LOC131428938 n=1 Tax=Malaya genurostris TaxID=325434 RepID=UPI0026F3E6C9|nr:uncharacterized protein LOC131428938 [Malaya genurostris]